MILSKKKKALFEKRAKAFSKYMNSKTDSVDEIYYKHQVENFQIFFEVMNWQNQYKDWLTKHIDKTELIESVSNKIVDKMFDQNTYDFSQAMDDIFKRPVEEKKMPDIGTDKNTWDTSRSKPVIDFMGSLEGKDKENDK